MKNPTGILGRVCMLACASFSSFAFADLAELETSDLDKVTAAGHDYDQSPAPNGGAIIGNGSSAILNSTGEVIIGDGSQVDAQALNMVNASESTVANGVNVFNGSATETATLDSLSYNVEQLNSVTQDQRRLSSLPGYERGANIDSSFMESSTSEHSSSASVFDEVIDLERTLVLDEKVTDGGFDRSSAPTLRIEIDGSIQVGRERLLEPGMGDGGIFSVDVDQYDVEFNVPSAANSVGVVFNGGMEYKTEPAVFELDTEILDITITTPAVEFGFDAMGCVAVNGNCSIEGSRTESSDTISDHSTLYTSDESSSSSSTSSSSGSESVQAAFELRHAQAEYIVVDESSIDVIATYIVNLSGGAQSGLRAMNVVNAAGSAVANGVNVAVMKAGDLESASPVLNLSQTNIINHSR